MEKDQLEILASVPLYELGPEEQVVRIRELATPLFNDAMDRSNLFTRNDDGEFVFRYTTAWYDLRSEDEDIDALAKHCYRQYAESEVWNDTILVASSENDLIGILNGYDLWLEDVGNHWQFSTKKIRPSEFLDIVAAAMLRLDLPLTEETAVSRKITEIISRESDSKAKRSLERVCLEYVHRYDKTEYSDYDLTINKTYGVTERELKRRRIELIEAIYGEYWWDLRNPLRGKMRRIRPGGNKFIDEEQVSQFMTTAEQTIEQSHGKRQKYLDDNVGDLIMDTLALIAVNGGSTAEKLCHLLEKTRLSGNDTSIAKSLPIPKIIEASNAVTQLINRGGGVELPDGRKYELDQLEVKITVLPEAFRRLLYASLDLDSTVHDKVEELIENLSIDLRIGALMAYAEVKNRQSGGTKKSLGKTALAGGRPHAVRGEELRRASGKPLHRAALHIPGWGQIS